MLIVTVGILFSSKVYMVEAYQCSLQPHCGMRVSSKHKVEFYLLVDLAFLTRVSSVSFQPRSARATSIFRLASCSNSSDMLASRRLGYSTMRISSSSDVYRSVMLLARLYSRESILKSDFHVITFVLSPILFQYFLGLRSHNFCLPRLLC